MPFCASCGAQVDGKFCPKCGASIVAGSAAPVTPPATYAAPVSAPMADNVASALCYALGFITGIIFLVLEPYSKNRVVRFHAFQSIFLHVAVIIVWVALRTVLPWGMWYLMSLIDLAFFVLWIFLLLQTYQGKKIVLPVIGDLAAKQA